MWKQAQEQLPLPRMPQPGAFPQTQPSLQEQQKPLSFPRQSSAPSESCEPTQEQLSPLASPAGGVWLSLKAPHTAAGHPQRRGRPAAAGILGPSSALVLQRAGGCVHSALASRLSRRAPRGVVSLPCPQDQVLQFPTGAVPSALQPAPEPGPAATAHSRCSQAWTKVGFYLPCLNPRRQRALAVRALRLGYSPALPLGSSLALVPALAPVSFLRFIGMDGSSCSVCMQ